jgi:hypothetical protein
MGAEVAKVVHFVVRQQNNEPGISPGHYPTS